jgi:hypothetical protein
MMHEVITTTIFRPARYINLRRDKRLQRPAFQVRLDDHVCDTVNWSMGGLYVENCKTLFRPGEQVRVVVTGHTKDGEESQEFLGEVTRVDEKRGGVALQFVSPSPQALAFFDRCLGWVMSPRR